MGNKVRFTDIAAKPSLSIGGLSIELPDGATVRMHPLTALPDSVQRLQELIPMGMLMGDNEEVSDADASMAFITMLSHAQEIVELTMTPGDFKKLKAAMKTVDDDDVHAFYGALVQQYLGDDSVGEA